MSKILGVALLSGLAFGTSIGCSKSDEAVAEELVALMEKMAAVMHEEKADCDAMGDQLKELMASNKELIEARKRIKRDPARAKVLSDKYRERVGDAAKKMRSGLLKCGKHTKVREAIESTLMK